MLRSVSKAGLVLIATAACSHSALVADEQTTAEKWQPLFNGRDLGGWYTFIAGQGRDKDPNHLIQVHNGVIHAYKDAPDGTEQQIGYFCTDSEHSHYRLRFQYKWGTKRFAPRADALRDAGLLYHVTGPDGRWGGVWPLSVECQVQETDTGDLITVDTRCTAYVAPNSLDKKDEYPVHLSPEKGGKKITNTWYISADKVCDRLEGWNDVEVEVHGGKRAVHIVNGTINQQLNDIEQPKDDAWIPLEKGRIAFQIESAEVMYRNIEILPLPADDGTNDEPPADAQSSKSDAAASSAGTDHLQVPPEFEVEQVAGPPLLRHPMMACLDDQGRLFVAESDGINRESVSDILEVRPHKILMLEDTDNDGKFDKSTEFATALVQANGAEWYDGALYVCSAPYVWRFRDTDNDGRADEQVRVAGKFNFDGMSSAFHGPVFGPDGRMYWSGGQHGWQLEQTLTKSDAAAQSGTGGPDADLEVAWTRTSPGAFSSWPDGSDPRNIGFGGIANPVETTFTEAGEVLGTIALLDYVENQRRDAVVHWIDGGLYYMKDFNYPGLVRTGENLVPLNYPGHVAPAGITRYRSSQLGDEYRDNYFFAEFNSHKISRLIVERQGATFTGQDEDFLTSTNPDTHFTDVLEDADGSLLAIDTGGWFLHGCPTSQIAKPSIFGAVYRVRRKGASPVADPRGRALPWDTAGTTELIARFDDPRFAVRDRAVHELAKRGSASIPALCESLAHGSSRARVLSLWSLNRIDDPAARAAIHAGLSSPDLLVRLAAIHCVGLHQDRSAAPKLIALLEVDAPAVRRDAATVLGQLRTATAVPALLVAAANGGDRFLEHAVTLALVRIGNDTATAEGLASDSTTTRRLALTALDQMGSPLLTRDAVISSLESPDPALQKTAFGILQNRSEWSDDIVGRLSEWLAEMNPNADRQVAIRGVVSSFWQNKNVRRQVAEKLSASAISTDQQLLLLEAIAAIDTAEMPSEWIASLEQCLKSSHTGIVSQALAVVNKHNLAGLDDSLEAVVLNEDFPPSLRISAASAVSRHNDHVSNAVFAALVSVFRDDVDSIDRLTAAQAIGGSRLSAPQLHRLLDLLAVTRSLEVPALLRAFEQRPDSAIGLRLVDVLRTSDNLDSLSNQQLVRLIRAYPEEVIEQAQPLLDKLDIDASADAQQINALSEQANAGNSEAGRNVFFGTRASCWKCHRVGNEGGQIGPNLSHIAAIRSPRDLAEAILFPSASFVRDFEPYVVITTNGKVFDGLIGHQTPQAIHLRLADLSEIRIGREEIDEVQPGTVSIMPQGLDKLLSENELRDLLSYLQTLK